MGANSKRKKGVPASGIRWDYDNEGRVWRYGLWVIAMHPQEGYVLIDPHNRQMQLLSTSLYAAMLDAAVLIKRYNGG